MGSFRVIVLLFWALAAVCIVGAHSGLKGSDHSTFKRSLLQLRAESRAQREASGLGTMGWKKRRRRKRFKAKKVRKTVKKASQRAAKVVTSALSVVEQGAQQVGNGLKSAPRNLQSALWMLQLEYGTV